MEYCFNFDIYLGLYTPIFLSSYLLLLVPGNGQTDHLVCGLQMSVRMVYIYVWCNSMQLAAAFRYNHKLEQAITRKSVKFV